MVKYVSEWCTRENMTKWCKRMKREKTGVGGVYLGVAGCYRPDDRTICLGKETIVTAWMHNEEEDAIRFLIDVLSHEEDHRAIHEVTRFKREAMTFDYLFGYPFNSKANKKCFRVGSIDLSAETLSPYGEMIVQLEEKKKIFLLCR